jgi:FdhE protein
LKALKAHSPELATAVDLQLATLDLFRRAQARVPLPPQLDLARAEAAIAAGRPVLRFADVPLEWSDYRWVLRETADLLRRFELVDAPAHAALLAVTRDGNALEPQVRAWFAAAVEAGAGEAPEFGEIFERALRPFIARCAEVWAPRLDLSSWTRGTCPICAGHPELAIHGADLTRRLVCGRCSARWEHPQERCPWCGEDRAGFHTTLSTRDGHYLLDGCDTCRRYVKCCDERRLRRPVLPWVDAVATMPLDAAAMQRGYEG